MMHKYLLIGLSIVVLSGCGHMSRNESIGTAVGVAGGALIGSQFGHGSDRLLGAGIGAVAGGALGNYVGRESDRR